VVISALGSQERGKVTICADGMRAILEGMQRAGVQRLLAVSAHGAAETHDWSLYALAVWAKIAAKMRDMEAMEELIRASDTDWTIVRPPRLTDGPNTVIFRGPGHQDRAHIQDFARRPLPFFSMRREIGRSFAQRQPLPAEVLAGGDKAINRMAAKLRYLKTP
jgi:uncharacterized protein YbjT (DUF2867 family)